MHIFEDLNVALIGKALDAAVMRQQAIAHNLANINTPGYKRLSVAFERKAAAALRADPDRRDLADVRPRLVEAAEAGNAGTDHELAGLSETVLHHHALLKVLEKYMAVMKTAVSEGKK